MAEIKPLDHWRRMDGVAAGPSEIAVPAEGVEISYEMFEEFVAECFRLIALGPKEIPVARPARVPFPARALRDRPWDISALVE
jgi:hypothetical protein